MSGWLGSMLRGGRVIGLLSRSLRKELSEKFNALDDVVRRVIIATDPQPLISGDRLPKPGDIVYAYHDCLRDAFEAFCDRVKSEGSRSELKAAWNAYLNFASPLLERDRNVLLKFSVPIDIGPDGEHVDLRPSQLLRLRESVAGIRRLAESIWW